MSKEDLHEIGRTPGVFRFYVVGEEGSLIRVRGMCQSAQRYITRWKPWIESKFKTEITNVFSSEYTLKVEIPMEYRFEYLDKMYWLIKRTFSSKADRDRYENLIQPDLIEKQMEAWSYDRVYLEEGFDMAGCFVYAISEKEDFLTREGASITPDLYHEGEIKNILKHRIEAREDKKTLIKLFI